MNCNWWNENPLREELGNWFSIFVRNTFSIFAQRKSDGLENMNVSRQGRGQDRDLGQGQLWSSFPCATFNKGSEGGKYSMSIIPIDILKKIFSNFFEQIFSHFLEEIFSSFPKEIFSHFLKRNTVKLWPSLPHATFNKGRQLEENIHYSFYFRKTFVCKKINDFNFLLFKKAYLSIFR